MDGPWADPIRRAFTVDDLAAVARPHGIVQTVVVQAVADLAETRDLLALAAAHPFVAGVVGWADLTDPGLPDALAALRAGTGGGALVGVRAMVQDEPDPDWLRRADVRRGLRAVADAGLVYDLLVRPPQLPAAVAVLADHPELTVVLDHAGKPEIAAGRIEPWAGLVAALAALQNVVCKVSGLVTEADHRLHPPTARSAPRRRGRRAQAASARRRWTVEQVAPYVARIADLFGPDRLLFGSDWPVCLLAADYGQVVDLAERTLAGLPSDDVFGGNARRVYRLPTPDRDRPYASS
jgi:L-fuconolactonase